MMLFYPLKSIMTTLRKSTLEYMQLKDYAPSTIRSYIRYLSRYSQHFGCCPSELRLQDAAQYLLYLKQERKLSASSLNAAYSALKILYVHVLKRPWDSSILPRPRRRKSLPYILSKDEVNRILNVCRNVKHRTILMLMYSAGLRISEVVRLKIIDIDSNRMSIRVDQGKGNKDRYSVLSKLMLKQLRFYWKVYQPHKWLFIGQDGASPYSSRSVQQIFIRCKIKAGVQKPATAHTLRHCFATHLIEAGADIYIVKQLLGHKDLKTTAQYLHLSNDHLKDFNHPLDDFDL
jgi:site-specific recombinase XerD